jgi:hypothetical protein
MRIYVASKFEERDRVKGIQRQLIAAGHTITYDWTTNTEISAAQARADLDGVRTADALVLVAERDLPYCGSLVEVGIALGCDIPIYVIGCALDRCIFLLLPSVTKVSCDDDEPLPLKGAVVTKASCDDDEPLPPKPRRQRVTRRTRVGEVPWRL